MSWHPLGPEPDPPPHVMREGETYAQYRERQKAIERAKDLAILTTQDVMDLLSEDLTAEMVRHRRLRLEYPARLAKMPTASLNRIYQEYNRHSYWGYDNGGHYIDLLEIELKSRGHLRKPIESKLLRRMNATKHHGPKVTRMKVRNDLHAYRQNSRKAKLKHHADAIREKETLNCRIYAMAERFRKLGRPSSPEHIREFLMAVDA